MSAFPQDWMAIVTGASSGIGAATARVLADAGVRVVLAARRADRLADLARAITAEGGTVTSQPTDVTDRAAVNRLAEHALEAYGRIDVLINNAGIMPLSPIRNLQVEEWDRMIDVNVKGVLYGVAAVLPTFLLQHRGHIINVSSVAASRPFATGVLYSATKFAVRALSDGLRLELSASEGIRVTDIEPGVVDTELTDHITDAATITQFRERWGDQRMLTSEDVAQAVLYAIRQPDRVNVNEILIRPTDQET